MAARACSSADAGRWQASYTACAASRCRNPTRCRARPAVRGPSASSRRGQRGPVGSPLTAASTAAGTDTWSTAAARPRPGRRRQPARPVPSPGRGSRGGRPARASARAGVTRRPAHRSPPPTQQGEQLLDRRTAGRTTAGACRNRELAGDPVHAEDGRGQRAGSAPRPTGSSVDRGTRTDVGGRGGRARTDGSTSSPRKVSTTRQARRRGGEQVVEEVDGLAVRPVEVLQHQDRRADRGEQLDQGAEHPVPLGRPGRPAGAARGGSRSGQLRQQRTQRAGDRATAGRRASVATSARTASITGPSGNGSRSTAAPPIPHRRPASSGRCAPTRSPGGSCRCRPRPDDHHRRWGGDRGEQPASSAARPTSAGGTTGRSPKGSTVPGTSSATVSRHLPVAVFQLFNLMILVAQDPHRRWRVSAVAGTKARVGTGGPGSSAPAAVAAAPGPTHSSMLPPRRRGTHPGVD